MRLYIHDFSGHPFQVQLSRYLAARGHQVVHGFSTQYVTGHGRLEVGDHDPATLRIEGLTAPQAMIKYSPLARTRFELSYANALRGYLRRETFDLVVACNIPLLTMSRLKPWLARRKQPYFFWHQDIYSLGLAAEAARKFPRPFARAAAVAFDRMEAGLVRDAAGVAAISDVMVEQYRQWGIDRVDARMIPNWAPIDDIVPVERDNCWAREYGLPTDAVRLMYAGTLGRKHNPLLLLELLNNLRERGVTSHLVVASEGEGADNLAQRASGRSDVSFVGFQPADRFSEVLGSADAVVALLEPDAARFSVPSKVHSYLSSGRPIVALVPDGNPAALDVTQAGGFVGPPTSSGAAAAAEWICEMTAVPGRLAEIGAFARSLAEARFEITTIGDAFEEAFIQAMGAETRTTEDCSAAHRLAEVASVPGSRPPSSPS